MSAVLDQNATLMNGLNAELIRIMVEVMGGWGADDNYDTSIWSVRTEKKDRAIGFVSK